MASKIEQLELPKITFEVRLPSGTWQPVSKLPPEGRVRIKASKANLKR